MQDYTTQYLIYMLVFHVTHGKEREVCKVLVERSEGKRSLGRPRRRSENGIRIDLKRDWLGKCRVDPVSSG
jgi:hypothetical protein